MRLLRLSCDRPSFKTLTFRPSGLSILVGEGGANGVGKTLAARQRDETLAYLGQRAQDDYVAVAPIISPRSPWSGGDPCADAG